MDARRVARQFVIRRRVVGRYLERRAKSEKKPSFEEFVKTREPYTHPETRNDVRFDSLPDKMQEAEKKKYVDKYGPIDKEKKKGILPSTEDLMNMLEKVDFTDNKRRQKIVHSVGGYLGKALKGLTQNRLVKFADKMLDKITPVTGEVTIGGEKEEYSEAKNYQIMGRVIGNVIAPGSFEMTPEEEKVGKQYFIHTVQSSLPMGVAKFAAVLAAGALTSVFPAAAPVAIPLAIGVTVWANSQLYKKLDEKYTDYWKGKGKDFDEVTASYINGYTTMDNLNAGYESDIEEIEKDSKLSDDKRAEAIHERYLQYQKDLESARKAQDILKKYGKKGPDFDDAFKKVMADAIKFGLTQVVDDLQSDEEYQKEFAKDLQDWLKEQVEKYGAEEAVELSKKKLKEMEASQGA